jgi:serine/threonine protein kinase
MAHRAPSPNSEQDTSFSKKISKKITRGSQENSNKTSQFSPKFYKIIHKEKTFFLAAVNGEYHVFAKENTGSLASIFRSQFKVVTMGENGCEMKPETRYALKVFNPVKKNSEQEKAIFNEKALLSLYSNSTAELVISSENEGSFRNENHVNYAMLYKYVEGQTLAKFLQSKGYQEMSLFARLDATTKLLQHYYEYISKRNILHGDIKPENMIVQYNEHTFEFSVELIDFGTGCAKLPSMTTQNPDILIYTFGATPDYQAPEIITVRKKETMLSMGAAVDDEDNSEKRAAPDVYSLGIVCAQIITGKTIDFFTRLHEHSNFKEKGNPDFLSEDADRTIPKCEKSQPTQTKIWELIKKMTAPDPKQRILISEAIKEIEKICASDEKNEDNVVSKEPTGSLSLFSFSRTTVKPPFIPLSLAEVDSKLSNTLCHRQHQQQVEPLTITDAKADESDDANYKYQIAAATVVMVTGCAALVLVCPPSLLLWALMAIPAVAAGAAYAMDYALDCMSADKMTASTALQT